MNSKCDLTNITDSKTDCITIDTGFKGDVRAFVDQHGGWGWDGLLSTVVIIIAVFVGISLIGARFSKLLSRIGWAGAVLTALLSVTAYLIYIS
jgi:hypothetical protein